MTKHTPGPWAVEEAGDDFEIYPVMDAPPPIGRWAEICTVRDYHDDPAANARLIAAAPDLLDALDGMIRLYVELVESGDAGFWDAEKVEQVIAGRAAIAKAEVTP